MNEIVSRADTCNTLKHVIRLKNRNELGKKIVIQKSGKVVNVICHKQKCRNKNNAKN